MDKKPVQKTSTVSLLTVASVIVVVLNIAFLTFLATETRTIRLLRLDLASLEKDKQILTSSQGMYDTYKREIEVISTVFPNEETIPRFIQSLEEDLRVASDSYSVKFGSLTPLVEQDKLYLLLVITMQTDLPRLNRFFESLEHVRYMTHVVSVGSKTPDVFSGKQEVSVGLKVYVQNPFTN